jgi:hypothetical protein
MARVRRVESGEAWSGSPDSGAVMDSFESHTHSFIIKIWLEETGEVDRVIWRGHITHVLGGERVYLKNLYGIVDFISPYLESMGIQQPRYVRAKQWMRRQKLRLIRRG